MPKTDTTLILHLNYNPFDNNWLRGAGRSFTDLKSETENHVKQNVIHNY